MLPLHSYPLLERVAARAQAAPDALAITDVACGRQVTYAEFTHDILRLAALFLAAGSPAPGSDLMQQRVVVLMEKGYLAPLAYLAGWAAGGFVVPVLTTLPAREQQYIVDDADCELIICDGANRARADALVAHKAGRVPCGVLEVSVDRVREPRDDLRDIPDAAPWLAALPAVRGDDRAIMLYTSGTTGAPKGAVTTHEALTTQVDGVATAWHWGPDNLLLHVLPLNHLHGICVALLPSLWAGAHCEMWQKFDADKVWQRWINEDGLPPVTMFFGVPTIYNRLIKAYSAMGPDLQAAASKASGGLRLEVSGSAPLPVSVKATWEADGGVGGGQVLIERYGMTETGIIASTGWEREKRVAGCVGFAIPGVEIRLYDTEHNTVVEGFDAPGEVQVRGKGVTKEYWRLPEVTAREFVDGWFKTGDIAVRSGNPGPEHGMYRILGRSSVDIIKSGGEKISAVEIERAILELPGMEDVAVVGLPDDDFGQVVGAAVVTTRPRLTVDELRNELRSELAGYKLPREVKQFTMIPRNGMGKVQKKVIVEGWGK